MQNSRVPGADRAAARGAPHRLAAVRVVVEANELIRKKLRNEANLTAGIRANPSVGGAKRTRRTGGAGG